MTLVDDWADWLDDEDPWERDPRMETERDDLRRDQAYERGEWRPWWEDNDEDEEEEAA